MFKYRFLFIVSFFLIFSGSLFCQEICTNGIDDDSDGLIDLKDTAECKCSITGYITPQSLIPNPSFEQNSGCPTFLAQLNLATGWQQASGTFTDYFGVSCGFTGISQNLAPINPPGGDRYIGFNDGPPVPFIYPPGNAFKGYAGACLVQPLQKDTNYIIRFYLGFGIAFGGSGGIGSASPMEISIFGNPGCSALPFSASNEKNIGCPLNAGNGWVLLGTKSVSGANQWVQDSIEFIVPENIQAVAIGPSCTPRFLPAYYYLDELALVKKTQPKYSYPITIKSGSLCDNDTGVFLAAPVIPELNNPAFQWYKDSAALPGKTDSVLQVTTVQNGTYNVRISTVSGCIISEPFVVNFTTVIKPFVGNDTVLCPGATVSFAPANIYASYLWNTGLNAHQLTVSTPGLYILTATDFNGCKAKDSAEVFPSVVSGLYLGKDTILCTNNAIQLSSNVNTTSYLWNTGSAASSITATALGKYWLKITDNFNCSKTDTIELVKSTVEDLDLGPDKVVCTQSPAIFSTSVNVQSYLWSNGVTAKSITVTQPGKYWIRVTDSTGCSKTDTVNALASVVEQLNLGGSFSFCPEDKKTIISNVMASQYLWNTGAVTSQVNVFRPGNYWLRVTDVFGCTKTDTVMAITGTNCTGCKIFVPNAFTPNGDGLNDIFTAQSVCPVNNFLLTVYNRWGEVVFATTNIVTGWDGTYKGMPQNPDAFSWVISAADINGKTVKQQGTILLLR